MQCQLESLADKKTPRDIRNALHDVPPTLEQTYRNILARIPKADVPLAKQMLLCICFSASVLTFNQLCEAVVVEDDCANLDEGMRLLHPEDLLNMCSSLISFDITTSTVVLAHSSVWTYLTSPEIRSSDVAHFALDPAIADNIMARKCINYLSLPVFESGYCEDKSELKKRFGDWPFLRYSARYWFVHLRSALEWGQMESTTQSLLVKFFQTSQSARAGNFGAWVQAFLPNARLDIKSSTPLYYAARFGLLAIVNLILDTEGTKDLEVPCGRRGSTPLHVAAAFGRTEIVKRLLEAGADAKEINAAGETGLQWAMLYDYVDIIQLLEDAGATLEGVAPMIRIK